MNNKKITAIIQARMRSTRLPGKVLMPLARKPALWWLINRILRSNYVNDVIVATTSHPANDPIYECVTKYFGESIDVNVFRYSGKEEDVMERVIGAAVNNQTDIIVDITGDCIAVDPGHIDFLISELLENDIDYASNCVDRSFPDGLDIQVYYTSALQECKKIFGECHHVGINIGHNPEYFNVLNLVANKDMYFPDMGLTLDTPEDYQLLKIVFDKFGSDIFFKVENVVHWLNDHPEILKINSCIKRKSIEEG